MFGDDIEAIQNVASLEDCIEICNNMANCLSLTYFESSEGCYPKSTKYGTGEEMNQAWTSWVKECKLAYSFISLTLISAIYGAVSDKVCLILLA